MYRLHKPEVIQQLMPSNSVPIQGCLIRMEKHKVLCKKLYIHDLPYFPRCVALRTALRFCALGCQTSLGLAEKKSRRWCRGSEAPSLCPQMLTSALSIVCCVTTDCAATHPAATPAPAPRASSSGRRRIPVKVM